MIRPLLFAFTIQFLIGLPSNTFADEASDLSNAKQIWPQWRGPDRDGQVSGPRWPDRLDEKSLERLWRLPLGPSYSGPIITEDLVFTTETKNKESEIVLALDRKTGKERWRASWTGAMSVPFFAASNGSWIRSTPAYDGQYLYVAGIRDVLVCLDAKTGTEKWRVDFVEQLKTPLPTFGFVCSPLVDGDAIYVQAGASLVKLNKHTGAILWRAMKDKGGMNGSAFSSPIIANVAGKRQVVVQTREILAGVDIDSGEELWSQKVPAFRGMNILTPVVFGDALFTSTYQNKSFLYQVSKGADHFQIAEAWNNKAQGYMSTPVVIDGHAYMHLQSERFACINLTTGERTWTSQPFGKYASLVAQGNKILALVANGVLVYIKANPREFELIDKLKISESETWAHLAISGNELFIRELDALSAFRWNP
jgi:hypothetical protein